MGFLGGFGFGVYKGLGLRVAVCAWQPSLGALGPFRASGFPGLGFVFKGLLLGRYLLV